MSTADNPASIQTTVLRNSKNGQIKEVPAPTIIQEYNNNMNKEDHSDQLRTEYSTYRTSWKWWHYLFWFLFDLCVTNGFILMKESANHQRFTKKGNAKKVTMLDFRMALAKQLIGDFVENERAALATVSNGHFPKKGDKKGRCRQCSKSKIRKEPVNMCAECNVHLCLDCFQPWHRDLLKRRNNAA